MRQRKAIFYNFVKLSDGMGGYTKDAPVELFSCYGTLTSIEQPRNQKTTRVNETVETKLYIKNVKTVPVDFVEVDGVRYKIGNVELYKGNVTVYTLGRGNYVDV